MNQADNPEGNMLDRDQRRKFRDRERRGGGDDVRSPGRNDRGFDDRYDEYNENTGYHRDRRDRDRDRGDRGRKDRGHRVKIEFPSFLKPMYTRKDFEYYQQQKFDKQSLYDAYNDYSIEYKHF